MTKNATNSSQPAIDQINDSNLDLETWVDELYTEAMVNSGLDALTIPNYASQTNLSTMNNSPIFRGGSSDKSQCGIPQEMMTMTSMTPNPNSSTATIQISGHIRPPVPKFMPNSVGQSSQSRRTTDMPQFQNQNQPLKQQVLEQNVVQQPPTHSRMDQSTINIIGQQTNNQHQRMPSEQLRPFPRPVSTIQTVHLQNQQALRQQSNTSQLQHRQHQMVQPIQNFQQNQNQNQLQQLQQPTSTSHTLIPEGGRPPGVQGLVIGEGRRKPPENRQGNHVNTFLGHFIHPSEFPSPEAWREYVFRQVVQMKGKYMSDLLKMHKKSAQLCNEETENMELKRKYINAREFLERMITFLNVPTVDMIPPSEDRVHNYMNFIVNYMISYWKKNGGGPSSQQGDQVNQQMVRQPTTGQQLQPNGDNINLQYNPQSNLPQGVINLESNMGNFNQIQTPIHQPPSSQSQGSQVQPNREMKLPHMLPPNSSQRVANPETNMANFNQNFPSRRPHGRMPSSSSFQVGIEQRSMSPLGRMPNVLGTTQQPNLRPNTSNVNVSGSSISLLKAATTANFPSRQLTHQQPSLPNQNFNSGKMKQPMIKMNEVTDHSKVVRAMSPLGSRLTNQFQSPQFSSPSPVKPTFQPPSGCSLHSVSSWQVNANSVLSPESIARSPFLLGSSPAPSHREKQFSSSGLSPLSTLDTQRPEIPIIAGLFGDQKIINNQVPDMGPPKAPTNSTIDIPSTKKAEESQDSKDPHHRLMEAVKSSSSRALGSSFIDIGCVKKSLDFIPAEAEPRKYVNHIEDTTNFLLKYDEPTNFIFPNIEDDSAFLLYEEEPERKVKRKLSITSSSKSLPEFSDYDSFKHFFSDDWDNDSTVTSIKKKPKIQCKNGAILAEIEEINSKLFETSMEMVLEPSEDSTSILEGHEGIIVTCLYKNVCFPGLLGSQGAGASSEMRQDFRIQLCVPLNYPASSPTILNTTQNVSSGPWAKLYEETVRVFERSVRELPQQMSLVDIAQKWDACARDVITEFAQGIGGKSFSLKYGSWESSSGSN